MICLSVCGMHEGWYTSSWFLRLDSYVCRNDDSSQQYCLCKCTLCRKHSANGFARLRWRRAGTPRPTQFPVDRDTTDKRHGRREFDFTQANQKKTMIFVMVTIRMRTTRFTWSVSPLTNAETTWKTSKPCRKQWKGLATRPPCVRNPRIQPKLIESNQSSSKMSLNASKFPRKIG